MLYFYYFYACPSAAIGWNIYDVINIYIYTVGTFTGGSSQTGFLVCPRLGQSNQLADLRALHVGPRSRFAIVHHGRHLRRHRTRGLACHLPPFFYDQVLIFPSFLISFYFAVHTLRIYYLLFIIIYYSDANTETAVAPVTTILLESVAHSSATGAASTANNVNEVATDLPDVVGPEMLNE